MTGPDTSADEVAAEPWPEPLPWQRDARSTLMRGRARDHHAWLLHGPPGLGKRILSVHLAQDLLCESPAADGLACGSCDGCRYVAAGSHPDLRLVEPWRIEADGSRAPLQEIGIDAIRDLTAFTQVTSHRRGAKVAVVIPAERLTHEAANALLKTLEEPPTGTKLLLVSHQPGRLLATVASRCLRIAAPRPAAQDALAWLASRGVRRGEAAMALAAGAPLLALGLATDGRADERAAWFDSLSRPERIDPYRLGANLDAGERSERKARLELALDALLAWTADLARVAAGGEPRRLPERAEALAALAPRLARVALCRYHQAVVFQRANLARPLNPRLVAESLAHAYRDLFAPAVPPAPKPR